VNFVFHPDAEVEFFEAIEYYEAIETGLGQDFSLEVLSTLQDICDHPLAWPALADGVRRCLTNRFPFGIIYGIEKGRISVLAVMHLRRQPDYWKNRH